MTDPSTDATDATDATDRPRLPTGVIENLGGRDVHWLEIGGDEPPVLLLGGCGVQYTLWDFVVETLRDEHHVRTVLMDRPGMAGSRWPGRLPLLAEEVDTLVAIIERIGRPTVVVGHSMAGPHGEALVRRRPDLVAGLVLLDGSNEWRPRPSRFETAWLRAARTAHASMGVAPLQALAVWADRMMIGAQSTRTKVALMPPWAGWAYRDPEAVAMVIAEQAAYGRQLADLDALRAEGDWPDVPTVVVTGAAGDNAGWAEDQARYARMLDAEHVVLPDSRHMIMLDRPDAVVDAVLRLRDRAG
ncbi:pimeloyl-ACP methyl ester carboxylesterase [Friedmanniella endophytica]|uniref:Pimeloyl-ACP methyl ester carboxylesterase n=1 Tax=Microlunatus kandeliicorticis TaxID=1759536 RepID=A0A7W3IVM4_9ACTN|nr:alpha/beta hydrolase [Microlunatus kandeliicorticis]MBA8796084.1 pimeloyl-ACP methyl ester carboxylesterase [Microlunatus kandeliicorticis]